MVKYRKPRSVALCGWLRYLAISYAWLSIVTCLDSAISRTFSAGYSIPGYQSNDLYPEYERNACDSLARLSRTRALLAERWVSSLIALNASFYYMAFMFFLVELFFIRCYARFFFEYFDFCSFAQRKNVHFPLPYPPYVLKESLLTLQLQRGKAEAERG